MRTKIRLTIEIFLVIAAVAVAVYNFSTGKQTAYFASIVAVCGTAAILAKEIYKAKKQKQ